MAVVAPCIIPCSVTASSFFLRLLSMHARVACRVLSASSFGRTDGGVFVLSMGDDDSENGQSPLSPSLTRSRSLSMGNVSCVTEVVD